MALVKAANMPPIQVITTAIANEINMLEQDFILVLDDLHVIKEKMIHDLLTELLLYPPRQMHLVLLGRSDSFLPIAKIRAKGQLAEIRLLDLQFTENETTEFLQCILHRDIDIATAKRWHERTEGWVTGLRLGTLALHHRAKVRELHQGLPGVAQFTTEYLFNEVLENQPKSIRSRIFQISILDRFSAPLCEDIWLNSEDEGELDGWAVINILKKENMFLVQLDSKGNWFRFHHLFLELLKKQLE